MDVLQMMSGLAILVFIWAVAIYQFSLRVWSVGLVLLLILISLWGELSLTCLTTLWMTAALLLTGLHYTTWRVRYLWPRVIDKLKKKMPPISNTEKEAIEAGDTWWEKELFCGQPNWKKLFNEQAPTLTQEEQHFLDHQVHILCDMLNDWEIVHKDRQLPPVVLDYLKKEKFFGLIIPRSFNGLGFSIAALSAIIVKIATRSISVAVTIMVPNTLGPGELLLQYGTEEQKNHYLPRLSTGEEMPCFALTALEAGSDAGGMMDKGIVCMGDYQGKQVLGMRVTWDKRYITLAPVATILGLAIHLYDPDHLIGETEDRGITVCLIPTTHPGVEVGRRHYPMRLAFLNGPTRGKEVFVPMEWVIGGQSMVGKGWRMLMGSLAAGRAISLPALAAACGKLAYWYTGAYARLRQQFNVPIAQFEGVQEALGYIAGNYYVLEACRLFTIGALQQHIKPAIASAIAKYHMTELSRESVQHAMDIHGGHAIQLGPDNLLATAYISTPISITVEGANILTRNLIIFGQGAIRCHPYLLKEMAVLTAEHPDFCQLDRLFLSHAGYAISTMIRNMGYGLTGGRFIRSTIKNKLIRKQHKQLTRMSAALALWADISLMMLGGQLKRRERLSARLGDVLSQLYLASAVLKYYHDRLSQITAEDIDHTVWALQSCLHKIQIALDELSYNFTKHWIGKLLRWIIFPYGTAYLAPKDKLHAKLALTASSVSDFRTRLVSDCYKSTQPHERSCLLDQTLARAALMEPLLKKVHHAAETGSISKQCDKFERLQEAKRIGLLTETEYSALVDFETYRQAILQVNEFSQDLNTVLSS